MKIITSSLVLLLIFYLSGNTYASDDLELSLEKLLATKIQGASKYRQKQSDVAAAVNVLTRNEIKAFGWRNLAEALASLPGVYATYDRQYHYLGNRGFSVPGDYNTRVLVLVNGTRVNDPTFDQGVIGLDFPIDIDLIERIEYIPGPGGAVYGQNAMFGVVNVITRQGINMDGAELSVDYQAPQAQRSARLSWGKRFSNGWDAMLSFTQVGARGDDLMMEFPNATITSGRAIGLDGLKDKKLFMHLSNQEWTLEHVQSDYRKDDPTAIFGSDPLVSGQHQGGAFSLTQLSYSSPSEEDRIQFSARIFSGRSDYASQLRYTTWYSFPAKGDWYGTEMQTVFRTESGHTFLFGLEAQKNTSTEQKILNLNDPNQNIIIPGSGYRYGIFLQDEWHINPAWSATFGVRFDKHNHSRVKATPRGALIWHASSESTLKILYGSAYRKPNSYERDYDDGFSQLGNQALKDESIDTKELVLDHLVTSNLSLRASLFHWQIHKQIRLGIEPKKSIPQYVNGENIHAQGIELSMNKTWGSGARLQGSYTNQLVRYETGERLSNSPQHMAKLNFSSPIGNQGIRLAAEAHYLSSRKMIDGNPLAGYWITNLHLMQEHFFRGIEISLNVYNLFDRAYQLPASENNSQKSLGQDGRAMKIKVLYRF